MSSFLSEFATADKLPLCHQTNDYMFDLNPMKHHLESILEAFSQRNALTETWLYDTSAQQHCPFNQEQRAEYAINGDQPSALARSIRWTNTS